MTQTGISDNQNHWQNHGQNHGQNQVQNQEENYKNDANANYLRPTTKIWFYIPFDRWFLSKDEKNPLQGIESWFDSPAKISQTINKPKKKTRLDLSLVDVNISKDPELLKQYYDLREEAYQNDSGYKNYSGMENNYDKNGRIFLATHEGRVVAGLRLVVSSDVTYLPHEDLSKNFTYGQICKEINIDLDSILYSEVSALAIDRSFRGKIIGNIFSSVIDHCRVAGIKYIFGISNMKCNRDYKIALSKIGVSSFILDKVVAPRKSEFNNIDSYPIIIVP